MKNEYWNNIWQRADFDAGIKKRRRCACGWENQRGFMVSRGRMIFFVFKDFL
jgi:hypothetical protein